MPKLKYRIKEILEAQGRKQDWVADQLGVHRSLLSLWSNLNINEQREIRYSTMVRLSNILGCTVEELHTDHSAIAAA